MSIAIDAAPPPELESERRRLQAAAPEDVLRWTVANFAPDIALSCSFGGPSGLVLVDMLSRLGQLDRVEVYYIDTGLLFEATHRVRRAVERRYGITAVAYRPESSLDEQAAEHGAELWLRDPDRCCGLRKVGPNQAALRGKRAWIAGLRRDQAATRAATPSVQWSAGQQLVKVSPLAGWTEAQVWDYVRRHEVPYNELHDQDYPSLGCTVCTTPVAAGDDARSGRWRGQDKIECGLHSRI